MIDPELRSRGIGGSEIACLVGLDPRRDAFAVYCDKLGLVEREPPSPRMKFGKRLERVIADAYSEETGRTIVWYDTTLINQKRQWQVYSPDAFVVSAPGSLVNEGILDAKNVAFDQVSRWGDQGTDVVPDHIALQMHWYCSAAELPWADIAALFGGWDLRTYRIHSDAEIEATLLDEGYRFWHEHVLARVPPPIGCSQSARDYLRQRFPRNVQSLRSATVDELGLLARLKQAKEEFEECEMEKESLENALKEAIADADGLTLPGKGKVTWLRDRDSFGADYQAIARELALQRGLLVEIARNNSSWELPSEWKTFEQMIADYQIITRHGPRKLRCTWPKENFWIENLPPAA